MVFAGCFFVRKHGRHRQSLSSHLSGFLMFKKSVIFRTMGGRSELDLVANKTVHSVCFVAVLVPRT